MTITGRDRSLARLYRRIREWPLRVHLVIPLTGLIVLALGADAGIFLATTATTRAGIVAQTLQDRPRRLEQVLTDDAHALLAAANYLAQAAGPLLAAPTPDLAALQRLQNDVYYRFNLDPYGFDFVRTYDAAGQCLLTLTTDPRLEAAALPPDWEQSSTPTLARQTQAGTTLIGGRAPILYGGRYRGQAIVGRLLNPAYLARVQQALQGPVLLRVDDQVYSSLPPAAAGGGTLASYLRAGLTGPAGAAAVAVGGQQYAARYGAVLLAGAPAAYAVLAPTADADRLVQAGLTASLGLLAGTLLLVLIGALGFATWISRPITRLAQAARVFQAGTLTARAPISGAGEIRQLGRALNAMAADLQRSLHAVAAERDHADQLLHRILPDAVAARLKDPQEVIADRFPAVTVVFADIVDFTALAAQLDSATLVAWLNALFTAFDHLAARHGLEKIKTVGDAYMAAAGLPTPRPDHALAVAAFALDLQAFCAGQQTPLGTPLGVRIGISSGPVVAGVIGTQRFLYDLWGDTVNTASRMEALSEAGAILVSAATAAPLQGTFLLEDRGSVPVKGKGAMQVYWLRGRYATHLASPARHSQEVRT